MPVKGPGGIVDKLEADEKDPDRWVCGAEAGVEAEAEATGGRTA